MDGKRSKTSFWIVLAIVNIVAVYYWVDLVLTASGEAARLHAGVVLIAAMLVLSVSDAICVLTAYGCWSTLFVPTYLSTHNHASAENRDETQLGKPALDRRVQCH